MDRAHFQLQQTLYNISSGQAGHTLFVSLSGVICLQVNPSEWRMASFTRDVGDRMQATK